MTRWPSTVAQLRMAGVMPLPTEYTGTGNGEQPSVLPLNSCGSFVTVTL